MPLLLFVQQGVTTDCANQIVSEQSKQAFFETMEYFYSAEEEKPPIGVGTYIGPLVYLGKNVRIGCNCTLDGVITIGDDTVISHNVTMVNCIKIGKRCCVQAGCRLGEDGFGYSEDERHIKTMVKHFGGISIGDDVLLSANTVVARGTIDDTVIESGTKIDTLCHIAHNVNIGKSCAFLTNSLLFGSSKLEKNVYIASAILRNQCSVGENAVLGIGAIVTKNVPANTTVIGNPAKPYQKKA